MALIMRHTSCINPDCGSSDAMSIYEKESEEGDIYFDASCFSCNKYFTNNQLYDSPYREEFGIEKFNKPLKNSGGQLAVKEVSVISEEEVEVIYANAGTDRSGYRGIKRAFNERLGILTEYDDTGQVKYRYYPTKENKELTGMKIRICADKKFYSRGRNSVKGDLFGMYSVPNARHAVIVGGEEDTAAALQMFVEYFHSKNYNTSQVEVLSATTGEGSTKTQIQNNYEYLDKFEKIYVCMDQDKAGNEARDKVLEVIPASKAYVIEMTQKDPNEALLNNATREFINAYYNAKKHTPAGILSSSSLSSAIRKALSQEKLTLPPFMSKISELMAGGIPIPAIINIAAKTGIGKTTIINEILYHWFFHSPYKVGVVSLELSAGEYGVAMLSRHLGVKLNLKNTQEVLEFLERPEVKEAERNLLMDEEGNDRWYLLDERDGSLEALKKKVEQLIISCGCRVIVLDPLQDILDGLSNEDQSLFMKWQKQTIKAKECIFVNISHVRKGNGDKLSEEDLAGSSTIIKSGHCNIIVDRDKEAEDAFEKNTLKVIMPKCRWTGHTGKAGEWYYDIKSHTLWDKDQFLQANPSAMNLMPVVDPVVGTSEQF